MTRLHISNVYTGIYNFIKINNTAQHYRIGRGDRTRLGTVLEKISPNRSRTGESIQSSISSTTGQNDCHVLAYLWIAIETKHNVLVVGDAGMARPFMRALSAFVPMWHIALDLNGSIGRTGRINFSELRRASPLIQGTERRIIEILPDRLFDADGNDLGMLFRLATLGVSFVSNIPKPRDWTGVVKNIADRYRIDKERLSALDISVALDELGRISSISEYRWLDKTEAIQKHGEPIMKRFTNSRMCIGGRKDGNGLRGSKVLESYASAKVCGMDSSIRELDARAEFLSNAGMRVRCNNPLERYLVIG